MFDEYTVNEMKITLVTEDKFAGEAVPVQFLCEDPEGRTSVVPANPDNRHFIEIKEWYNSKKKKPFVFDFESVMPIEQ